MTEFLNFKEAFQTLKSNADTLRTQQEPDIDLLLSIVKESNNAYQFCKKRIDAVEQELRATLIDQDFEFEGSPESSIK